MAVEQRTLTIFTITDPDEPEHHNKTILDVALKHAPLTQFKVELRLRAVAREFGETWAGMAKAFHSDADTGSGNHKKVVAALEEQGFEPVLEHVFFKVAGTGQVRRPHKAKGLLEDLAVAATEPTAERKLEELCLYVKEELKIQEEDLDTEIHDAKGQEAADINNGGMQAQIEYLTQGMTFEAAKKFFDGLYTPGRADKEVAEVLDSVILEFVRKEQPEDEVTLCSLVSKKLGIELTLEQATKYLAALD